MRWPPLLASLALCAFAGCSSAPPPAGAPLLAERFERPDGLITNEYAAFNPDAPEALVSPTWVATSGSLFARGGHGWTGRPDGIGPDASSRRGTDSAVFRLITRRADFTDVAVSFAVRNLGLTTTRRTPATAWDGVHVWVRYIDPRTLYYASVNRRDETVVIKKKLPGGPSNGGTYFPLCEPAPYPVPYGEWQRVRATVDNEADGGVRIALYIDGRLRAEAVDRGVGGPPIRAPGKVGLRGDNAEFEIADFAVTSLGAPPAVEAREPLLKTQR